jgi:peptide-methionine (S)-S-oxide reductase
MRLLNIFRSPVFWGVALLLAAPSERTWAVSDSYEDSGQRETATLGGGCFWCLEAIFEEVRGVRTVESGYTGGDGPTTYKEVCSGQTGHAEVVRITFDPQAVSFAELLAIFFGTHDPTTLNRQGADVGTQYRSAIFYESESQKSVAESVMRELKEQEVFDKPIVTQLEPLDLFYPAESYHQDYYRNNPGQGYCMAVINPKLAKFRKEFADKRK